VVTLPVRAYEDIKLARREELHLDRNAARETPLHPVSSRMADFARR
jgi:hypothetical protein